MKDKQIEKLIKAEEIRQKNTVSLIASENYVSDDVLKALGSKFTNKYSEGYPHKRYYKGQINTDKLEELCKERVLKAFGLSGQSLDSARDNSPLANWHVNVQPLSGSPANLAVYLALVPAGGKVMGMSLNHGGHLTHGHKVSATGKLWTQVPYGVNKDTEVIDYDELKKIALENKPNMIIAGFTAYPRIVDFKKFRDIADMVVHPEPSRRTILMVDMSHFAGLVAGGAYPSPFPYADIVTTTVHKTLRGPRSALIFSKIDEREFDKKIDKAVFPGLQGGPHMNQIAAVAVALKEASTPAFKKYAHQVVKNAKVLAEKLKKLGWKIISGGTDSHLILVDTWNGGNPSTKLRAGGLSGEEASTRLEKEGIIVNKNTIPNETRSPMDPSGIRLGTAGETTRGKKERDMIKLAKRIDSMLRK